MVLIKTIAVFLSVFCLIFTSCLDVAKESTYWTQFEDASTLEVEIYYHADDGTKLFLPKTFKTYSSIEYLDVTDSLVFDYKGLELEVIFDTFSKKMLL